MTINTEWFQQMIEERFGSQRRLAKEMAIDQSAVVRILNGERRMQIDEAEQLADLLEVSLIEVLENVGVKFDSPRRRGPCPLCGRK